MEDALRLAMGRLSVAEDFEAAAGALLDLALDLAEALAPEVAEAEDLGHLRVLRGLLHLRSDESYRALVVRERGPTGDLVDPLPSAGAWRLLEVSRAPVSCDLALGDFEVDGELVSTAMSQQTPLSRDTVRRLRRRAVTHFHARPLALPGGRLMGMLVIEVDCPDAAGSSFGLWRAMDPALAELCALGPLYLDQLPARAPDASEDAGPLPALSEAMAPALRFLRRIAPSDGPILLTGETGVGKTRLARWVHERSPRATGPFISADLFQLPDDLATARLFGANKGAWTGAGAEQAGCIEEAEGGTLLLDEVGELSLTLQARLLRFLDERRYKRVGGTQDRLADVRVIACTNVDLDAAVRDGRFRRDLFHRLNIFRVEVPPLRRRREELAGWCGRFLVDLQAKDGGAVTLKPELVRALEGRSWPGNLRELRGLMEQLLALSDADAIGLDELEDVARLLPGGERASLSSPLRAAAEALLAASADRERRGASPLGLEQSKGAFPGMVVAVALERAGDTKQCARALGLEGRITGGNHLATFRRYGGHLAELLRALGEDPPEVLAALMRDE